VTGAFDDPFRTTLMSMYGAAAAVERDDRAGLHLLLNDLYESYEDFPALLTAMSYVTLDRLDAALALSGDRAVSGEESRELAQRLLVGANSYAITDTASIHAAAQRLDAVRRHDTVAAIQEVRTARAIVSDADLLCGATALLTATIGVWADRAGEDRTAALRGLCLASLTAA